MPSLLSGLFYGFICFYSKYRNYLKERGALKDLQQEEDDKMIGIDLNFGGAAAEAKAAFAEEPAVVAEPAAAAGKAAGAKVADKLKTRKEQIARLGDEKERKVLPRRSTRRLFLAVLLFPFYTAPLVFWGWFGLSTIAQPGGFYNCIGECAVEGNALAVDPSLFNAAADALNRTVVSFSVAELQLLSQIHELSPDTYFPHNVEDYGEAITAGSGNSSLADVAAFGTPTAEQEKLNKAVVAMYAIGLLFAAMFGRAVVLLLREVA